MALRSGQKSETKANEHLSFILLGNKQVGKSATGNTILGRKAFISKKSSRPTAQDVTVKSGTVDGYPVTVYDTPGFCDSNLSEEEIRQMINKKVLQKCESSLYTFLLVIKADTLTKKESKTMETIEKILGEKHLKNTWILFTRGDELEDDNMTIQELIDDNEELKTLVQKYDHRYHVFNNKKTRSTYQARILLMNVLQRFLGEKGGVALTRHIPEAHQELDTHVSSLPSMRIALLGKTGVGKSASGNTILGHKEFISELNTNSVTSVCLVKDAIVSGRSVSVVDTPGLFDTEMEHDKLATEIARSVYLSSPGPHAFLIVLRADDRFTEQEQQIPQMIEIMFGQEVLKYSIILFARGDQLEGKTVEELINGNSNLRHLVQQCGGRYQLFNNRDLNNRDQVNDLLDKIDSMIQQNGGGHYTNQMYEDAHRLRLEEKRRKLREEEQRQLEGEDHVNSERERRSENPEFEQFLEHHNSHFNMAAFSGGAVMCGAGLGAVVGGLIGLFGGPAGVMAGIGLGLGVGAAVGGAVGVSVGNQHR